MHDLSILLINPRYRISYGETDSISAVILPMGLAYLASVLQKNNFNVKIVDANVENKSPEDLRQDFRQFNPDVVGITCTTPVIYNAFETARIAKEVNENVKVVIGGPHPTSLPFESLAQKSVDFVVPGEGEFIFLDLMNALATGTALEEVKGIFFKKNSGAFKTNPRPPYQENLDEIPFPAYNLLPMRKYFSPITKHERFANILTSRGCPGQCIYCNKNIAGFRFRPRSPENIVDEMELLINSHGVGEFHVLDDCFSVDKERVHDFCVELRKRNLDVKWKLPNGVRVNTVDEQMLNHIKKAGCYSISFGIESGNQQILDRIRKGITLAQSEKAVELAKKAGIFTIGFFMLGNLGENQKTMQQTIDFAVKLDPDVAQFSILTPFPGTVVRKIIDEEGRMLTNDWSNYANLDGKAIFEHGELTKKLMEKMFHKAYKQFFFRPKYFLRKALSVRSVNDLKIYSRGLKTVSRIAAKTGVEN